MPEKTLLLTDSSTFLPSTFADATGRPDRYMTLHFANQIWRNNLTELMRHDRTSDESFELAEQFSHAIGMVPLKLNKEQPGYILNTLLIPWFKAAMYLVASGVTDPATVDLCWELDTGARPDQTPFRKIDKVCHWRSRSSPWNLARMAPPLRPARWLRCSRAMWMQVRLALPWGRASTSTTRTET
jgi:3-hydroxyacyl-CoA dehydrogenase